MYAFAAVPARSASIPFSSRGGTRGRFYFDGYDVAAVPPDEVDFAAAGSGPVAEGVFDDGVVEVASELVMDEVFEEDAVQ